MTTQNPMTLEQVRDWCAETKGFIPVMRFMTGKPPDVQWLNPRGRGRNKDGHPYPATLDGAARAWDDLLGADGWGWSKSGGMWRAWLARSYIVSVPDTGNEIADRFNLVKACWEAAQAKATQSGGES